MTGRRIETQAPNQRGIAKIMASRSTFNIRDVVISPATVLAPMAGVTDTIFRRMIRALGGCGLIMTEFTSAEGVTRNAARTLALPFL